MKKEGSTAFAKRKHVYQEQIEQRKERDYMKNVAIPDKFLLTFEEAARYFGIGENKLRRMADFEENPDWILYNGKRRLIKRVRLEQILMNAETI